MIISDDVVNLYAGKDCRVEAKYLEEVTFNIDEYVLKPIINEWYNDLLRNSRMNNELLNAAQKLLSVAMLPTLDKAALKDVVNVINREANFLSDVVDLTPTGPFQMFLFPKGMQSGSPTIEPDPKLGQFTQGYVSGPSFDWFEKNAKDIFNDAYARRLVNDPFRYVYQGSLWYRRDYNEEQYKEIARKLISIDEVKSVWETDAKFEVVKQHAGS